MYHKAVIAAGALIALAPSVVVAGTTNSTLATTASTGSGSNPSHGSFSRERLKELRAHWRQNKAKLAVCRKEARSKGLIGDDRWFFIEDCMGKS